MAGVDAILGSVSVRNLAASKGAAPVSAASGMKQFENFLKDSNSAKDSSAAVHTANTTKVQESVQGNQQDYAKKEEFSVNQAANKSDAQENVSAMGQKDLSPEEAGELAALQEEIRDVIKENLGIDDETINAVLQAMGIGLADLFQPEVLQQFVLLAGGGGESTDFLINEDLMQTFTNLMQALEDFQSENQNFLEKLETPVLLEEFLQQEGLSAEDFGIAEEAATEDFQVVMESAGADVSEEEMQDTGKKVDAEQNNQITSGQEDTKAGKDSITLQNSNKESDQSGTESELFFSQRGEMTEERAVDTPLFAEQFRAMQEDGVQLVKPQWNGMQRMQQMIDIVNQVSERIRSVVNANTTSVEVQLNPESLGKVFFSVVSKGGVMTANFQVQTEEAKNALESQIMILKDNLEAKNLKVESVEVHVSDFSFDQSNQAEKQAQEEAAKQGRRRFRYDAGEADESEQVAEVSAEQVRRQVMRDSGGSIDFTA
jgi:flagellar hook-length control protein FliK